MKISNEIQFYDIIHVKYVLRVKVPNDHNQGSSESRKPFKCKFSLGVFPLPLSWHLIT